MGAPGISSTNPAGLITPKQSPPPTIQQTIQPAQSPPAIAPPPRLLGSRRGSFSPKPTRQPAAEQADIDFQQRYGQQEQPGVAQHIGHTVEQRITDAYNQLDQGGGNTVTMYRLKQALPDVPKDQFDQAVLRMTNGQDAPFLGAVHDSASRMPESVRSDFVYDPAARESSTAPLGSGAYYVSMYKRPPSEPLAQRMGRQVWQALGGPKIGGQ
jgi:hypothetical protein